MLFMCFVNGGEQAFANFSVHVYVTLVSTKLDFCHITIKLVKYLSDQ